MNNDVVEMDIRKMEEKNQIKQVKLHFRLENEQE